jgi:hypothetical protein
METMNYATMRELISAVAIKYSTHRLNPNSNIWDDSKMPSSPHDMDSDWNQSCLHYVNYFMEIELSHFAVDCYLEFENIWLDDIKKFRAYHLFINNPSHSELQNYYDVCNNFNNDLLIGNAQFTRPKVFVIDLDEKGSSQIDDFDPVKKYLEDKYINKSKTSLIKKKEDRIIKTGGDPKNGSYAKKYVDLFYDNIIPAVTKKDSSNISCIIQALSASEYTSIINAFEAKIAISYLDKNFLGKESSNPENKYVKVTH